MKKYYKFFFNISMYYNIAASLWCIINSDKVDESCRQPTTHSNTTIEWSKIKFSILFLPSFNISLIIILTIIILLQLLYISELTTFKSTISTTSIYKGKGNTSWNCHHRVVFLLFTLQTNNCYYFIETIVCLTVCPSSLLLLF